ncbi:hypothetical protein M514_00201 [Trichuris suis]|uniref:Uncharacterized protein n=1 Tax=Trichuris suis TaxID=68888 RepID=A0A085NUC7_9BILA|nr:hypothetical protein M514_00201 [Trichuris suis]
MSMVRVDAMAKSSQRGPRMCQSDTEFSFGYNLGLDGTGTRTPTTSLNRHSYQKGFTYPEHQREEGDDELPHVS